MAKRGRPKKSKSENFKLTLKTGGQTFKTEGKTIDEAIFKIPLDWTQIKYKGVIKVSCGKIEAEKLYYLVPLKRMFVNKTSRFIQAKYLEKLLDSKKPPMKSE